MRALAFRQGTLLGRSLERSPLLTWAPIGASSLAILLAMVLSSCLRGHVQSIPAPGPRGDRLPIPRGAGPRWAEMPARQTSRQCWMLGCVLLPIQGVLSYGRVASRRASPGVESPTPSSGLRHRSRGDSTYALPWTSLGSGIVQQTCWVTGGKGAEYVRRGAPQPGSRPIQGDGGGWATRPSLSLHLGGASRVHSNGGRCLLDDPA